MLNYFYYFFRTRPIDDLSCKVTLDITSNSNNDMDKLTKILRDQIRNRRRLGTITVSDVDFTSTIYDSGTILQEYYRKIRE